jgi:hypothetical protein
LKKERRPGQPNGRKKKKMKTGQKPWARKEKKKMGWGHFLEKLV